MHKNWGERLARSYRPRQAGRQCQFDHTIAATRWLVGRTQASDHTHTIDRTTMHISSGEKIEAKYRQMLE